MGLIDEQRAAVAFNLDTEAAIMSMSRDDVQQLLVSSGLPREGIPFKHTWRTARKLSLVELREAFYAEISPARLATLRRMAEGEPEVDVVAPVAETAIVTAETAEAFLATLPRAPWAAEIVRGIAGTIVDQRPEAERDTEIVDDLRPLAEMAGVIVTTPCGDGAVILDLTGGGTFHCGACETLFPYVATMLDQPVVWS